MATIEKLYGQVRARLGRPSRALLPDTTLLLHLWDRNQHYSVKLRNRSNEGFSLKRFPLAVVSGTDEYPLAAFASDFTGAFLVTTDPDAYADQRQREVRIIRIQDADIAAGGALVESRVGTEEDSVEAIAFFALDGQWRAKVYPRESAGNYLVWYEPAVIAETSLQNSPGFVAAFHNLLAVSTAIDCLPFCQWDGLDAAAAGMRKRELTASLGMFKMELEREFDIYAHDANSESTGDREMFSSSPGVWDRYRGGGWY